MKKVSLIFIIFLLMINCLMVNIEATEESQVQSDQNVSQDSESESQEVNLVEKSDKTIDTRAKVIEAGDVVINLEENTPELVEAANRKNNKKEEKEH